MSQIRLVIAKRMHHYLELSVIQLAISLVRVFGANYCNPDLCKKFSSDGSIQLNVEQHIACENKNQIFGPSCPTTAKVQIFKSDIQSLILLEHNKYRNRLASGQVSGYKSASRMLALKWQPELSMLALLNAKTCLPGHDKCRNTPNFKRSGQNKFRSSSSGVLNLTDHLVGAISWWFDEYKYASMSIINKFQSTTPVSAHFTTMIGDRQNYVGCGTVRFSKEGRDNLITTCNYASTNIVGVPIYKAGPAGSKCKSGRSSQFPSLCSAQENIDPNAI